MYLIEAKQYWESVLRKAIIEGTVAHQGMTANADNDELWSTFYRQYDNANEEMETANKFLATIERYLHDE